MLDKDMKMVTIVARVPYLHAPLQPKIGCKSAAAKVVLVMYGTIKI